MKKVILLLAAFMLISNSNAIAETSEITTHKSSIQATYLPINDIDKCFNNKINFVFSDIDGTLLPFNTPIMPKSVKIGVEKLQKANIPIVLATGRSVEDGIKISKGLGINSYVIGLQGAEIANPEGKIIYRDGLNIKEATKVMTEINNFNNKQKKNLKFFFCADGKTYAFEDFNPPFIGEKLQLIKSTALINNNAKVTKIAIYSENMDELKAIQCHLKKLFPYYHIDISSRCYCDISSLSATKGNGIKKVAELLNINLSTTAVFGDAENDISMFKLVKNNGGLAVAVGNAMPIVKQNAGFTTASVLDGGFEKAVEKILAHNKKITSAEKDLIICK